MTIEALEYGIYCQPTDEKKLVKNINNFLKSLDYRNMYKWKPRGVRDPFHPENEPKYSHYYCQFLKQQPRWYFDIYPNIDLNGNARFPEFPDVGWTLYVSKSFPENNSPEDDKLLDEFFANLVSAVGYPTELLHTYKKGENRR